jgi:hypothetical protein
METRMKQYLIIKQYADADGAFVSAHPTLEEAKRMLERYESVRGESVSLGIMEAEVTEPDDKV